MGGLSAGGTATCTGGLGGRGARGSFLSPGRIVAVLKRVLSCGPTVTLGFHFWAHCAFVTYGLSATHGLWGSPPALGSHSSCSCAQSACPPRRRLMDKGSLPLCAPAAGGAWLGLRLPAAAHCGPTPRILCEAPSLIPQCMSAAQHAVQDQAGLPDAHLPPPPFPHSPSTSSTS